MAGRSLGKALGRAVGQAIGTRGRSPAVAVMKGVDKAVKTLKKVTAEKPNYGRSVFNAAKGVVDYGKRASDFSQNALHPTESAYVKLRQQSQAVDQSNQ